jgi:peptidoglycan/xylan/chitin deacetylase (PgdA/CDA1 family)
MSADDQGPTRDHYGYGRGGVRHSWPGDAPVAVNVVMNVEEGSELSFWEGDAANPQGLLETPATTGPGVRDLAAESVFEYGSRAGVWRIARIVDEADIPVTLFATGMAIERHHELAAWVRERGHEVAGHGYRWDRMWEFSEAEEREEIRRTVEAIERSCGTRPYGWYSRYSASVHTRRLLAEQGFRYDSDSYADDVPYWVTAAGRPHLVVPYTLTLNDGRFATSPGYVSPTDFVDHALRAFEQLRREGHDGYARMMTIALHSRLSGQPARASAFREIIARIQETGGAWFATRLAIADLWTRQHPPEEVQDHAQQ